MSFGKVASAQTHLLEGHIVDVEVDLADGLHAFSIVGLPDKAVEEARDRVSAAIKNSGFSSPKAHNKKIVVSLAPAHLKKEGSLFDVPIALAYLLASGEIDFDPSKKLFLGELSLDGKVRPVSGTLPLAKAAKASGYTEIYVPFENATEAALIRGINVYPIKTLKELLEHLSEETKINLQPETKIDSLNGGDNTPLFDIADIRGQETGKRGLLIAAAGGHNIALWGPAGTGKTMLARALSGILPPLTYEEILEVTAIHSVAGALKNALVTEPPIRSPHHTSSYVSLIGGGATPRPGEITLAHRGALFMDEFPEFERRVIDALRQPLEDRVVTVSRAKGVGIFPADFILIAALNPCACGNLGSSRACICTPSSIAKYQKKISGPIIDRIDLWIEVPLIDFEKMSEKKSTKKESVEYRNKVIKARTRAKERMQKIGSHVPYNSAISAKDIETLIPLDNKTQSTLNRAAESLQLSPRQYHKIIKLARTIADLDEAENVLENHLLEALQYRKKESF